MRKMNAKTICLVAAVSCVAMGTVSCTDSDYDLSNVDMTVGLGGGELKLPVSSSDVIPLKEVLKFSDSEVVDTIEGGDYMFAKNGDAVSPAHPEIDRITVMKLNSQGFDFDLGSILQNAISGSSSSTKGMKRIRVNITESKIVNTFEYGGPQPQEVEELKEAYITAKMKLTIRFSENLKKLVGTVGEMKITLPTYMSFEAEGSGFEKEGTSLVFKDISTSEDLSVAISINKLSMGTQPDELGKLESKDNYITMDGNLKLEAKITDVSLNLSGVDYSDCKIESELEMDDAVMLDKVTGRFAPTIDLSNLGEANITGLPDFLTEGDVCIDLDNPQIALTLESDLTVGGELAGNIKYWRNGQEGSFSLPKPIKLKAPTENSGEMSVNRICICRDKSKVDPTMYDQVIETENIKDLLYPKIIDKIAFSGAATADKNNVYTYELGKTYTVQPSYRLESPLAFGEDAKIVYTEKFEDWNKDIKDFDVTDGTCIVMEAVVENRIPVHLNVEAIPLGIDGSELPSNVIKVDIDADIKASPNGTDVATSDLHIVLTPAKQGLKKLNGIKIKVSGAAKDANGNNPVKGITLNARKHSLVLQNIRLSLKGKAVADLN